MGCCEQRQPSKSLTPELGKNEVLNSKLELTCLEVGLAELNNQLSTLQGKIRSLQLVVTKREKLNDISHVLSELEDATQAQYISERHSTLLQDTELLVNLRSLHYEKRTEDLIQWTESAKQHIDGVYSIKEMQAMQVTLSALLSEVESIKKKIKKVAVGYRRRRSRRQSYETRDSPLLENPLESRCESLISDAQSSHRAISTLIIKAQEAISDKDLKSKLAQVQECIDLTQTDRKPLGRKSYKEISEEIIVADVISRTSTNDTVSQLEDLFPRLLKSRPEFLEAQQLHQLVVALLQSRRDQVRKQSTQSLVSPQPIETFVIEYFQQKYGKDAAERLKEFASGLEALHEQAYAVMVSRALHFTYEKRYEFLPKLLADLQPFTHSFDWKTGGEIPVPGLISAIEQWFYLEPELGAAVISKVAASAGLIPFLIFYINLKIQSTRLTPEELFTELDPESRQRLTIAAFVDSLKKRLPLLILDEDLRTLGNALDTTHSDAIFRTEFIPAFQIEEDFPAIACVTVLESVEGVYTEVLAEQAMDLFDSFSEVSGDSYRLSRGKVVSLLQDMRPALSESQALFLISKAKLPKANSVSFEEFRELVWRNGLKFPPTAYFSHRLLDADQCELSEELMEIVPSLAN